MYCKLTTMCLANALARSFTVSVFPVPAGPAGAPPRCKCNAPVSVRSIIVKEHYYRIEIEDTASVGKRGHDKSRRTA